MDFRFSVIQTKVECIECCYQMNWMLLPIELNTGDNTANKYPHNKHNKE